MPCLAADAEVSAQVGDCESPCLGEHYEAFAFDHRFGFLPWHNCHFGVTYVLVLSVTYVLGLNPFSYAEGVDRRSLKSDKSRQKRDHSSSL